MKRAIRDKAVPIWSHWVMLIISAWCTGLFWLNLLFIVIAWVVARSVRGAVVMIAIEDVAVMQ
jgi:hypothetical protein